MKRSNLLLSIVSVLIVLSAASKASFAQGDSGQIVTINNPAQVLYDKIFDEPRPAEKLKLIADFEDKYVVKNPKPAGASMKAQVFGFAVDIYEKQGNATKAVEYGEKSLQYDPKDVHVLVTLARLYASAGNVDHGGDYARRAIAECQRLQSTPPQKGFTKESWAGYLKSNQASAQATLDYIRSLTQRLLQTRRNP